MNDVVRRLPVGAEFQPEGVHFRVWAPRRTEVQAVLEREIGAGQSKPVLSFHLEQEPGGYFSGFSTDAGEGSLYRFRLDREEALFPDPASRFQPFGPLGPSQVVNPNRFAWTDGGWEGKALHGQIFYEMHIGTFTREGTYAAAMNYFEYLADTGITIIQLMPLADFPGCFGWGYDGVDIYAPTRLYGSPDDLRMFVDRAHGYGLGVILDVVYNHLGPVGNFLKAYSLDYFSDKHETEWGDALNFDGRASGPVREFIACNAAYWIREFHFDGLRLDATQSIFDESAEHILAEINRKSRDAAGDRSIVIIAENEPQDSTLIRSASLGGFGLDALLNDDFHHTAMVAISGRNEAYYSDYLGTPQELVSSVKWGFLYQGQFYTWQNKRRGSHAFDIVPEKFVNFLQNHDQVANSPRGERCLTLTSQARYRALTALLFLTPATPLLFQGQEFCASSPFLYFADHEGEMARIVNEGRADFLKQFQSLRSPDIQKEFPDPSDPKTFERSKLDHSELEKNRPIYLLHLDLLKLRREDSVFSAQRCDWMHGAVLGQEAFLLRFFGGENGDRLILVNLGRDLGMAPAPEPLLSPPDGSHWEVLWSSEAACYGGSGTPRIEDGGRWHIPGHSTIVMAPKKVVRAQYA